MSIRTDAQIIRDEKTRGANTATRIGNNLVAIADDLIAKDLALDGKQSTLVSGTNIKTINGSSLLGSGDIVIGGVGSSNINSVNSKTGTIVLNADDIDDTLTNHKFVTSADITKLGNLNGINTGDQDLSPLALKTNVLQKNNTTAFTPISDYQPATKKYVDDSITAGVIYTNEQAQDAVGGILLDSSEINFIYNDSAASITAVLITGSIDVLKLDDGVQTSLGLADTSIQPAALANFETTAELNTRDTNNRARANHTGTQTASTISDFQAEVSANPNVIANNAKVGVTTQISNLVEDTTPQLGGNLDLNGHIITGLEIGTDVQAQITVSTTAPSSPATNQLWVDIN